MLVELIADVFLDLAGVRRIQLRWDGDARLSGRALVFFSGDDGFDARGTDPPFGYEAISGQAAMENAAGGAVLVVNITANDDAEAFDIEESVFDLERIESPFDEVDVSAESPGALFELETATEAAVAVRRKNAHHVAMNIVLAAGFEAGDAEAEGDHLAVIEGA